MHFKKQDKTLNNKPLTVKKALTVYKVPTNREIDIFRKRAKIAATEKVLAQQNLIHDEIFQELEMRWKRTSIGQRQLIQRIVNFDPPFIQTQVGLAAGCLKTQVDGTIQLKRDDMLIKLKT